MEYFNHDLSNLFSQLGLNNSKEFIEHFIDSHTLQPHQRLTDAPFFLPTQQNFLKEAQQQDADWCEVIDQLDILLRKE